MVKVLSALPVTGAVRVKVPVPPPPVSVAIEAGEGLLSVPMDAVPVLTGTEGTTLLNDVAGEMLFVTSILKVTVSPLNAHDGLFAWNVALNPHVTPEMIDICPDATDCDVRPPLAVADAVNVIVPGFVPAVYVQTKFPFTPAFKFTLLGVGLADVLAVGLPLTTLSMGGLFAEVTPVRLAVLLLAMFIVKANVHPGPMDDDDSVHVTTSDFSVHTGRLLIVAFAEPPQPAL